MGKIVYESEEFTSKEDLVIKVEVDQIDSPYRRKNAIISIDQEDINFARLTPSELIRLGKFLIKEGKYIKEHFDANGNRKEVPNG